MHNLIFVDAKKYIIANEIHDILIRKFNFVCIHTFNGITFSIESYGNCVSVFAVSNQVNEHQRHLVNSVLLAAFNLTNAASNCDLIGLLQILKNTLIFAGIHSFNL